MNSPLATLRKELEGQRNLLALLDEIEKLIQLYRQVIRGLALLLLLFGVLLILK